MRDDSSDLEFYPAPTDFAVVTSDEGKDEELIRHFDNLPDKDLEEPEVVILLTEG